MLNVYPNERHTEGHRYAVRRALTAMRMVPVDGIGAELDGSGPDLRARADFAKATEHAVRTHHHRRHLPSAPPAKLTGWAECALCDCAEYVPGQEVQYVGICCASCAHVRRDHRQV